MIVCISFHFQSKESNHGIQITHLKSPLKNHVIRLHPISLFRKKLQPIGNLQALPYSTFVQLKGSYTSYTRRGTPFAALTAAGNAIQTVVDQGMQRADVMIKGPGLGREAALRAISGSRIRVRVIRDVTPMSHNGCRAPKKRRV
ncbi:unnamed protein product [Vicia faba]|uniref:Ribosomal protein S11 n=1 Tax=Vicia faba TaxID=3906 RepID=A0AAV1AJ97_VICFA|nr:unnamed protein product [Vicia faba]